MRGGANGNNSGYNSWSSNRNNDEKKIAKRELDALDKEMEERQAARRAAAEAKKKAEENKKKAGAKGRRSARRRVRGKRCVSKKLGGCGLARRRRSRRRSRR